MLPIKEYFMTGTKKHAGNLSSLMIAAVLICLMTAAIIPIVQGASAVNLGSAGNYAILTKTGISTTGTTTINGNIGVSPIVASAITGFGLSMDASNQYSRSSLVNGGVYAANYAPPTPATMTTAVSDMEAAYTSAAGQAPAGGTELYAGNLGGRTLAPGVYKWSSGVLIPSATVLTLDGQGNAGSVWVFQIAGDLTMDPASRVALINGAQSGNVYWQVAGPSGAILGSGAHAEGTILTQKAIAMNSGASVTGRLLAQTAVTLIANSITSPSPSSVPAQSSGGTGDNSLNGQTPAQQLAPGQTATPTQTAVPTPTPSRGPTSVRNANVGGDTAIGSVEVLGTGHNDLIITGARAYYPDMDAAAAPGTVYQYADLKPARYTSIDQAVMAFTIPNAWLESNHITPQNILAYGQNGLAWTALPTTFVKVDGSVSRFTAITPSLSTRFAITGQNYPVTPTPYPVVTNSPQIVYYTVVQTPATPATLAPVQLAPTQPSQVQGSPVPFWVPVIAVIGTLMVLAVRSGRKGKNS